ncbi:unannotated protein [freshwater metagenome]|uniref:Unannotated protein n=1 Tax=freshwater metagenome TaxID=449393 RepID=A0A6J7D0K1_9ZZZZ|nr:signal peptidase II [Actinomycetota bacterium]
MVAVDLASKWLVTTLLHGAVNAGGLLSLMASSNSGIGFSAMRGQTVAVLLLSIVALLFCARLLTRVQTNVALVALALIVGGGLSNLLDRALHGGQVTDFVGVSSWFVCNGADIAISLGVVLLIVSSCTGRKVLR